MRAWTIEAWETVATSVSNHKAGIVGCRMPASNGRVTVLGLDLRLTHDSPFYRHRAIARLNSCEARMSPLLSTRSGGLEEVLLDECRDVQQG